MPEPGTNPPSPTKAASSVATAAGGAALLFMWLILSPPPSDYRTAVGVIAVTAVLVGGVLVLVWLVRFVEYRFVRRYTKAEEAQREHRQFVEQCLNAIVERQLGLDAEIALISEAIDSIDDRTQKNCKHIRATETQVGRCMAEIGIVGESIDELREAFVEEGLPQELVLEPASRPKRRGRTTCRAASLPEDLDSTIVELPVRRRGFLQLDPVNHPVNHRPTLPQQHVCPHPWIGQDPRVEVVIRRWGRNRQKLFTGSRFALVKYRLCRFPLLIGKQLTCPQRRQLPPLDAHRLQLIEDRLPPVDMWVGREGGGELVGRDMLHQAIPDVRLQPLRLDSHAPATAVRGRAPVIGHDLLLGALAEVLEARDELVFALPA